MLRKFWRPILWRWHRRLGLTLILLLLWLSVTGLFLNHTDDLELAERPLGYAYLLQLYGIDSLPVTSFASANETVFSQAGDHLYLQSSRLTQCRTDQFSFLVVDSSWLLAACGVELVMLTPQGEVVERIGAAYDIPQPLTALGLCDEHACIQSASGYFSIDVDTLTWQAVAPEKFIAAQPIQTPADIEVAVAAQWVSAEVNWQRLMLDLHAGRSFGLGPWLMDAVAILIIILSLSGLGIWLAGRKRR